MIERRKPRTKNTQKVRRVVHYPSRGPVVLWGIIWDFLPGVSLFNSRGRWWLAYLDAEDHNTGGFPSKKAAIKFYNNNGR